MSSDRLKEWSNTIQVWSSIKKGWSNTTKLRISDDSTFYLTAIATCRGEYYSLRYLLGGYDHFRVLLISVTSCLQINNHMTFGSGTRESYHSIIRLSLSKNYCGSDNKSLHWESSSSCRSPSGFEECSDRLLSPNSRMLVEVISYSSF